MSKIFSTLLVFTICSSLALAAGTDGKLPLYPNEIFPFVSDSIIAMWISVILILLFAKFTTKKMELVPSGFQNFGEWVIESVYNFFEGILGAHLAKRTFWFLGSTFLLILLTNWLGLIPGVGTMGFVEWGEEGEPAYFLRGGNADINMTASMGFTFAILWVYWAVTETSWKELFAHIFAPKGQFAGLMRIGMLGVFFFVGILEVVSIAIRPVALSFRLFGNMYGGEQTMIKLMALAPEWLAFAPALPLYFLKLLVGLVQALVFTLLCAVFIRLICEHEEEH